jgi:hypothetical protein
MSKRKNPRSAADSESENLESGGYTKTKSAQISFHEVNRNWRIRIYYRTSGKNKYERLETGGYPSQDIAQSEVSIYKDCLEYKSRELWISYDKRQPPGSHLPSELVRLIEEARRIGFSSRNTTLRPVYEPIDAVKLGALNRVKSLCECLRLPHEEVINKQKFLEQMNSSNWGILHERLLRSLDRYYRSTLSKRDKKVDKMLKRGYCYIEDQINTWQHQLSILQPAFLTIYISICSACSYLF